MGEADTEELMGEAEAGELIGEHEVEVFEDTAGLTSGLSSKHNTI